MKWSKNKPAPPEMGDSQIYLIAENGSPDPEDWKIVSVLRDGRLRSEVTVNFSHPGVSCDIGDLPNALWLGPIPLQD